MCRSVPRIPTELMRIKTSRDPLAASERLEFQTLRHPPKQEPSSLILLSTNLPEGLSVKMTAPAHREFVAGFCSMPMPRARIPSLQYAELLAEGQDLEAEAVPGTEEGAEAGEETQGK